MSGTRRRSRRRATRASTVVDVTTTLFWDRYLRHDISAAPRIVAAVRATDGKATLQRDLSAS